MNDDLIKIKEILEKELAVESNTDNKTELQADISAKVLHVMDSLHSPHLSSQMDDSKDAVFERVCNLIDMESATIYPQKGQKRKAYLRYTAVAAAVSLLIVCISASYFVGNHFAGQQIVESQVEMSVPYGTTSKITLSDGTKVVLNGGSTLSYPSVFTQERHVSLSGEAYFDVAKDEKNAFVVHSEQLTVKVLGTRFGFKSYKEDLQTILTLEEGSVSALPSNNKDGIILKPNQQLVVNNETGEFRRQNVDAELYVSWKEDVLNFRDLTLDEIAIIIERRFNIKINIESDVLRNERYVAQFRNKENTEQILDKLSHKRSWKYIKQDGIIKILDKNKINL